MTNDRIANDANRAETAACRLESFAHAIAEERISMTPEREAAGLGQACRDAVKDLRRLSALLHQPHVVDFLAAVELEAAHQRDRWGEAHDRRKGPEEWYWLVGFLGGKALRAHLDGDRDKTLHHTISTAAALAQWHAYASEDFGASREPAGESDLEAAISTIFGRYAEAAAERRRAVVRQRAVTGTFQLTRLAGPDGDAWEFLGETEDGDVVRERGDSPDAAMEVAAGTLGAAVRRLG